MCLRARLSLLANVGRGRNPSTLLTRLDTDRSLTLAVAALRAASNQW
jgi:hypothetical protein